MRYLYTVVLFTIILQTTAYSQVSVFLQQPPPYQFKMESLWKVTLINPTVNTYKVYLKASATDLNKGKIVSATTASFLLPPGSKVVSTGDLVPVKIDVSNSKFTDVVQRINGLPSGNYEICVTAVNAENGSELGMQCMQAQAENISQIELIRPDNFSRFGSGTLTGNDSHNITQLIPGSLVTFSWVPPAPIPAGTIVTYSLKISEILMNQSPYDAIQSNPAFYKNKNIYSNLFVYPIQGRSFQHNRRYAWNITAYINNVKISESEVNEFSYIDLSVKNTGKDLIDKIENRNPSLSYKSRQLLLASIDDSQLFEMMAENEEVNETKFFEFTGSAKLSFETGHKDLPFTDMPKNIFTAELNPSVSFFGLPFSANFLISSQQNDKSQSMNSASFNFDINSYKEQIRTKIENKIVETATGWESFFLSINALGIGTNYPDYSELTLKGVPVTGLNFEMNPGILYLAFTASKNLRSIENISYERNLYAARLGIGKKEESHLIFTGMFAKDNENSLSSSTANQLLTPKANYIFGTDTKLSLFDEFISFEGEGNISVLTRDTRDAALENDVIPSWINNLITPKLSTSFDYAYNGKMVINSTSSGTRITVGLKMIGPGYTSLGAPNLRSDQLGYEGKLEQSLLARKISISSFFRTSYDNLIEWKSSRTTVTAMGVNLGLNFPDLPFLQLSYSPFFQHNNSLDPNRKIDNKTNMLTLITGYPVAVDQFNFMTTVSLSSNKVVSLNSMSDFQTRSMSISESISFDFPITFSGTWGIIKTNSPLLYSNINNFDFSFNGNFYESLSSTLGINLAYDRNLKRKTGVYLSAAYMAMENISLNTRIESSFYRDDTNSQEDFNEVLFNIGASLLW